MITHQFNVASRIEQQVFWFKISVNDSALVKVRKRLQHATRVKARCAVVKNRPKTAKYVFIYLLHSRAPTHL